MAEYKTPRFTGRRAAVAFAIAAMLLVAQFLILLAAHVEIDTATIGAQEKWQVERAKIAVEREIEGIVTDILVLARAHEFFEDTPAARTKLATEFEAFIKHRKKYTRAQFFDLNGTRAVDIGRKAVAQFDSFATTTLREAELTQLHALGKNRVSLQTVTSAVVAPGEPKAALSIRLGTPIFDSRHRKTGFFLIELPAHNVIEQVGELLRRSHGEGFVLSAVGNDFGEILLHIGADSTKKRQELFASRFPDTMRNLSMGRTGRISLSSGRYLVAKVDLRQTSAPRRDLTAGHANGHSGGHAVAPPTPAPQVSVASDATVTTEGPAEALFIVTRRPSAELAGYWEHAWHHEAALVSLFFLIAVAAIGSWYFENLLVSKDAAQELSRRDPLTGLFNSRVMKEQLQHEIDVAKRHHHPIVVIYLDLDNFKAVNDNQGHKAGDLLLLAIAEALNEVVRAIDIPCRYGGDEFCILMPSTTLDQARAVCRRLIANLEPRLPLGLTLSFGIAKAGPETFSDADALVQAADSEMYRAKALSKKNPGHHISSNDRDVSK